MSERILIIDDDIDTLKLVGLMLERHGYEISVASGGEQGLQKARIDPPNLILLDIMMPDMDGYEVTRQLRSDPALTDVPIIMFTAKSLVEDKVSGFEAGADDYLTKPTHPAELTAHVKAILARSKQKSGPEPLVAKGKILGILGTRGGLGTTTLAINAGIALKNSGVSVVLLELTPGAGSLALELKIENDRGLHDLLNRPLQEIKPRSIEAELIEHESGVRLLLSSPISSPLADREAAAHLEAIVRQMSSSANLVVLDLGAGLRESIRPLLSLCDLILLVVEPIFPSNSIAAARLQEILDAGIDQTNISMALVTRIRTSMLLPWREIEAEMGIDLLGVIPPAPEQTHHASQSGKPLLLVNPDSVISSQIISLSQKVAKKLKLDVR